MPRRPGNGPSGDVHQPPDDTHEWVSFPDPEEDRTWLFDVTFLESQWTCIFGRGCQGVLTGPAPERSEGCCSYGAHFTDEHDAERVEAAAAALTAEQWQFHRPLRRPGGSSAVTRTTRAGQRATRLVDDACIFLNRPGFPRGAGCALHLAALDRGQPPLQLKPDVCWQLPLRREDHQVDGGHVTSVIRQWDRRDWGAGGHDFHWWCTQAPDAFVGSHPVYRELRHELQALVGSAVYRLLVAALEARQPPDSSGRKAAASTGPRSTGRQPDPGKPVVRLAVAVPHPAVRHKQPAPARPPG